MRPSRPTLMRSLALPLAALLIPLSLAACSSDDDGDVASDPAPTTATSSPSPTAVPTVGTYPAYEPTNYTYELTVSCFCPGAGAPIAVTVADGEVTDAMFVDAASGNGEPPDQRYWLTINDVIDEANDTKAERVDVEWPAGQDYPTSVYVDGNKQIADDETGYKVANVVVT